MDERNVFIITPFSDFGKLIVETLSQADSWKVKTFSTIKAFRNMVDISPSIDDILIDLDLGMDLVRESAAIVREKFPGTPLILISKNEPPQAADDIAPWKLLRKPFVAADLFEIITNPLNFHQSPVIEGKFYEAGDTGVPLWARNKEKLLTTMESVIPNLDVVGAFVFSKEGVLAQARVKKEISISSCSGILEKHLETGEAGEIFKHVHLDPDNYILHGKKLAIGIILALLFIDDTPYHIVRKQSGYFTARILNSQLPTRDILALPERVIRTQAENLNLIIQDDIDEDNKRKLINKHPRFARKFSRPYLVGMDENQSRTRSLPSLRKADHGLDGVDGNDTPIELDPEKMKALWSFSVPDPNPVPLKLEEMHQESSYIRSGILISHLDAPHAAEKVNDPMEKARKGFKVGDRDSNLKNIAAERSLGFHYTCLLFPRLTNHLIAGDLAIFLNQETRNIFVSYGWMSEMLVIKKEYMQWIVRIPSTVSPDDHIQQIRKMSSKMILSNFPMLNRDGLLPDFWAPGYMLASGKVLIPEDEIMEFIQANRRQYYPEAGNS